MVFKVLKSGFPRLPGARGNTQRAVGPRQRKAKEAVQVIRDVTSELIQKCYEIAQEEGTEVDGEEYVNESDPTILRFLIDAREEVTSTQLRDDLLSMLVSAGIGL